MFSKLVFTSDNDNVNVAVKWHNDLTAATYAPQNDNQRCWDESCKMPAGYLIIREPSIKSTLPSDL